MLAIDGHVMGRETFPDGTPRMMDMPVPHVGQSHIDFTWCFDDTGELVLLSMASMHYRERCPKMEQRLEMPYIPNARMDRVRDGRECFTLKWFCEMVNALGFDSVRVLDAHSDVSVALLDRSVNVSPDTKICCAITDWKPDMLFYPDAGAAKRYGYFGLPVSCGNKVRDWKTGKIEKLEIASGGADVAGARVLIVDDITSYGGTFRHASRVLKDAGAVDVALYVSHAEKSVFEGKLFAEDDIDRLYTTDSILREEDVPSELRDRVVFVHRFRQVKNEHPTRDELRAVI